MYFGSTIYTDISSKTVLAFCCFRFRKFEDAIFLTWLLWSSIHETMEMFIQKQSKIRNP